MSDRHITADQYKKGLNLAKADINKATSTAQSAKTIADQTATALEEVKKSVSEGKSAIASTLTKNGVSTAADATFETINENIGILAANKSEGEYSPVDLPTHPESISITEYNSSIDINLTYSNTNFLSGVLVTYKQDDYPTSPTDGEQKDVSGSPEVITIDGLEKDVEYYFRAFLYNQIGDTKYYQTDVVNARISGKLADTVSISSKNVGDIVKIKENGELVNFLIVHKGNPDSSFYDESCNGVWLLREQAHSARAFSSADSNDIENSDIQVWLNGEYLNSIDSKIRKQIKNVKIPFKKGQGNASTGVQSGADGLPCKVFLLSGYEVGFTQETSPYFPIDGAKLSYFIEGKGTDAREKRIGKNPDSAAVYWWLRSSYASSAYYVWYVDTGGSNNNGYANNTSRWARPAFVLPSNLLVNSDDEVIVPDDFEVPPGSLEETDWETISKIAEQGRASEYWNIGDTKTIQLSTGEEITVRIEDFDHDDLTTGGKAPVTFGMVDCLKDTQQMNSSNTNNGGWGSSAMRTSRMATLFSQLPADLQKVIKSVTKTTSAGNGSSSLTTTDDLLWLFSYTEVNFDHNTSYSPGGEGTAYPLFVSNSSRIKKANGSAGYWWLRSPFATGTTYFCFVYGSGNPGNYGAGTSFGVVVGFCI